MLAEKAMDLANAVIVGIVLSQFVANEPFKGNIAFMGTVTFVGLHTGAYLLMKKRGGER
jgi:hypothetical protein